MYERFLTPRGEQSQEDQITDWRKIFYCAALLFLQNRSCREWRKLIYCGVERHLSQPKHWNYNIGRVSEYKEVHLMESVTRLAFREHRVSCDGAEFIHLNLGSFMRHYRFHCSVLYILYCHMKYIWLMAELCCHRKIPGEYRSMSHPASSAAWKANMIWWIFHPSHPACSRDNSQQGNISDQEGSERQRFLFTFPVVEWQKGVCCYFFPSHISSILLKQWSWASSQHPARTICTH